MQITHQIDPAARQKHITISISDMDEKAIGKAIIDRVIALCAEQIAAVFLETHQNEILAKLDTQAVANLAVAASGAAVREELHKALPSTERIIEQAVVYQRGIFGGIRRV